MKKTLKYNLLLVPSLIILSAFSITLLVFNVVIHRYIENTTAIRMNRTLAILDDYYNAIPSVLYSDRSDEELVIPVHYILLDSQNRLVFPKAPWYSAHEKERTSAIVRYVHDHPSTLRKFNALKIHAASSTYYVKSKIYRGSFDGYFITRKTDTPQNYTLLLFSNISPIQEFLDLLNEVLLLLMIGFGILAVLAIFTMANKIQYALNKLKKYLLDIGNRELIDSSQPLAYEEFNDVLHTMQAMAAMIHTAEQTQKQFFQNASHELRTPLMSIQGYAEGIQAGIIQNEKAAEIIIKESRRMSALVDEILFLSKVDQIDSAQGNEIFLLDELIYDCSGAIKKIADDRQISIRHIPPERSYSAVGKENHLARAISNILSNAVRYAKSSIILQWYIEEQNIFLHIVDDGTGISEEDLPHIFERFYKGKDGNFGIGLSITQSIVKQHGGEITVNSQVGRTEFILRLPILADDGFILQK